MVWCFTGPILVLYWLWFFCLYCRCFVSFAWHISEKPTVQLFCKSSLKFHDASQKLRNIWLLAHCECNSQSWLTIVKNIVHSVDLKYLLHITRKTKKTIVTHTLKCWLNCQEFIAVNSKLLNCTSTLHYPTLWHNLPDGILYKWKEAGIHNIFANVYI